MIFRTKDVFTKKSIRDESFLSDEGRVGGYIKRGSGIFWRSTGGEGRKLIILGAVGHSFL